MLAVKKHPGPITNFFGGVMFCSPYNPLNTAPHNRIERKITPVIRFKLFTYPIKTNIQNVLLQPTERQISPTEDAEHTAHTTIQYLLKL